ncbi:LTA synthase family protein [Flagellimonas aequoris]|uniref:Alkaline phosphatase family protein n=1 Tax=Flagellimonas aequoris TaxID=2306997 RepID=A0A418N366_9FLAO|nr:alkaline phosphatase family protein [Allomuricauda aequoris]RIV68229.1 alkaline phosphatase family protein [Allomuricauda aequoris]TXJ99919.1 sulfatase-like hydrolase/transferase [Allomuricauda aequoris]
MLTKLFPARYALLRAFVLIFLSISLVVRGVLLVWDFQETDTGPLSLIWTFVVGFVFDLATLSFFVIPYLVYLVLVPSKWSGSLLDRVLTFFGFFLGIFILYFSFLGEFTFWDEFHRRYNFIAVDYLIYTYEVVQNINESYPLPLLIGTLLGLVALTFWLLFRFGIFQRTFSPGTHFAQRSISAVPWLVVLVLSVFLLTNEQAEWSSNRYNNEISKAGIYSFFAAFRNNELSFPDFYMTVDDKEAFSRVKNGLGMDGATFVHPNTDEILRTVTPTNSTAQEIRPNVVFICVESLSGKFLKSFGNELDLTPNLDSLAGESLFFTQLYATGTRTVRGMEAITLSIPPTPGRSIVKRVDNAGLFTIGEVFEQKGYERNFFYGGDGYFDNMNSFFGGNGFNIVDRGRGFLMDKSIRTKRTNIDDDEVTFENAWGVCDEDIYNKVLKEADRAYGAGQPFFDFVMTTSNHKPYTYPEGKIDIPSGTGRNGAVKYTDYAIGEFLRKAKGKPWFANTVFVIMADHCASSAGRWELDVQNYQIPALIYNLPQKNTGKINNLCSQIDMFPTLFGLLGWDYTSNLFGKDVLQMTPEEERAFIGNYRKLGLLKGNQVMVLGDQKNANFYDWDPSDNSLKSIPTDRVFLDEAISWYQVADFLYSNGGLKLQD